MKCESKYKEFPSTVCRKFVLLLENQKITKLEFDLVWF